MKFQSTPIGNLVKVRGGGTPKRDHEAYFRGDIPWVTPKDMKTWEIRDSQIKITEEAVENSATTLVPCNTVLLVVRSGILKNSAPIAINRRVSGGEDPRINGGTSFRL
jgi:type I restriction enzyme, S subunit